MIYVHWLFLVAYSIIVIMAMVRGLMDNRQPAKTPFRNRSVYLLRSEYTQGTQDMAAESRPVNEAFYAGVRRTEGLQYT